MNLSFPRLVPASATRRGRAGVLGFLAAATLFMALPACTQAQDADPVVAKVNGVEIKQSDIAIAEEEIGSTLPPGTTADGKRDYIIKFLSDVIVVAQAGEQKKLADTPEFKRRMAFARQRTLMEMMLKSEADAAVTDAAMHQVYDEAVKQNGSEQEVKAAHILVESEDEAKAILAQLKGGADFATLAKEKSKDPSAQTAGGDLGYFTKEQMVPEFAEAAFKMEKGQLSEPIKTQFGWHIIKVEDKRTKPMPTYDQVKPQLEAFVKRKAQAEMVTKLRESAKIERLDQPATPPATPNPAAPAKK